jgi:hypothetical protein
VNFALQYLFAYPIDLSHSPYFIDGFIIKKKKISLLCFFDFFLFIYLNTKLK